MSAITLLTYGAQAKSGASDAVDVSAFSTLRLDATKLADLGQRPWLKLYIETRAAATAPWRVIWERYYTLNDADLVGKQRIVLSGFDNFVRVRWEAKRQYSQDDNDPISIGLHLGVTGDGQPDAA